MRSTLSPIFNLEHFTPSLRAAIGDRTVAPNAILRAAIPTENPETHPKPTPKFPMNGEIIIAWKDAEVVWQAPSLQSLFRGDLRPPEFGASPVGYDDAFLVLDLHALEYGSILGDPTDLEMREVYSNLRRRPDGRRQSFLHEFMWQGAVLMAATRPISREEFEAILARIERSCRTFSIGLVSRNYLASLHGTLGKAMQ